MLHFHGESPTAMSVSLPLERQGCFFSRRWRVFQIISKFGF